MINFLISNWKSALIFILLIVQFSWIGFVRCKEDKQTLATEKANTSVLRVFLVDSIRTADLVADNAKLDSVKSAAAFETKVANANAAYWEKIARKRGISAEKYRNKADSLASLDGGQCKDVIDAFRQANDTLKSQNTALGQENEQLDIEAEGYSRQLFICEQQSSNKDSIIKSKDKMIFVYETQIGNYQCYRDWGFKHRFWKWVFGWKCD